MENNRILTYTLFGLFIAFFGAPLINLGFSLGSTSDTVPNSFVIKRELCIFFIATILIVLVYKGEKLDLASIGLHNRHWGKSILTSLLLAVICIVALLGCVAILNLAGISFGEGIESKRYATISLWTMTLVVLRAGIVEEIFYRGYIMERLAKLSRKWIIYFLLPALTFGLLHYKQGVGGILISFVLGLIFAYSYWKTKDLKINIIAHFLVDFIPNVLIPFIEKMLDK